MQPIPSDHPLRRHFSAIVEDAFYSGVGMCNPDLTEYMTNLLIEFTHIDQLQAIRHAEGKPLHQIAAMLAVSATDQTTPETERDRLVYRHIGDYTLFWTGLYPEQLRHVHRDSPDVLHEFVTQGKRSYAIVSDLTDDAARPPSRLFRNLSEDFEFCMYGLGLVRGELARQQHKRGAHPGDLLR